MIELLKHLDFLCSISRNAHKEGGIDLDRLFAEFKIDVNAI